jgi:hypothetical protein
VRQRAGSRHQHQLGRLIQRTTGAGH